MRAALLLALLIAACPKPQAVSPKPEPIVPPNFEASQKNLTRDSEYFTSPALQGRSTHSEGIALAADYIAQEMKAMGLAPGENDSYSSFLDDRPRVGGNNSLLIDDRSYQYRSSMHFYVLDPSPDGEITAEVICAGYGQKEDFKGLDVSGKIVLLLVERQDITRVKDDFSQLEGYQNATALGASALIFTFDPSKDNPPYVPVNLGSPEQGPFVIFVSSSLVRFWLDTDMSPRSLSRVFSLLIRPKPKLINSQNVVGVLEPKTKTSKTILIGAHYDHLGTLGDTQYPGADDNASGTAALLEIARVLSAVRPRLPVRIIFCAFTAEEGGLQGSRDYVNTHKEKIALMLNFDMVGRLRDDTLYIGGDATQNFHTLLTLTNKRVGLTIEPSPLEVIGRGDSDHTSFITAGVMALHFFTGLHEDHHKPTDTADKMNIEGLAKIVQLTVWFICELAKP